MADAEVVGGVESSPTKYVAFSIQRKDDGIKVAKTVADAWNRIHSDKAVHNEEGRVTFPGNVRRTCFISFSNGTVAIHCVPDGPNGVEVVAGLKVFSPTS